LQSIESILEKHYTEEELQIIACLRLNRMSADPRVKKLKVQTGVVKRISKEKASYEKEADQLAKKVQDMEASKADEYVIKKQKECLEESRQMVPDTRNRLSKALEELRSLVAEYRGCWGPGSGC
uniref:Tubulin-specific chaperone A n=1 Tax=Macrostomum lignano TaxID=282301 RepID=A0A1I8JQC3_9PLAT